MKKKRKVRFDPLEKIDLTPPTPPDENPLSLLQACVRAVQTTEVDGLTGVEGYNHLIQHPERTRFATNCYGPGTLRDELGFRRIVFFFGPDGKVMGGLDDDSREQLAQVQPPISEAELIAIMEAEHAEWLQKQEEEYDG